MNVFFCGFFESFVHHFLIYYHILHPTKHQQHHPQPRPKAQGCGQRHGEQPAHCRGHRHRGQAPEGRAGHHLVMVKDGPSVDTNKTKLAMEFIRLIKASALPHCSRKAFEADNVQPDSGGWPSSFASTNDRICDVLGPMLGVSPSLS